MNTSLYNKIFQKTKNCFDNIVQNNDFFKKLKIKKPKGEKELFFIIFIKNQIEYFKNKKDQPYILPSCRMLAKILNCSKSWIACLINKYQKLFNFCDWTKQKIKKAKMFCWKFKNKFKVIKSKICLKFKDLNLFVFKTKSYKNELYTLKNLSDSKRSETRNFFELIDEDFAYLEEKKLYTFED